MFVTPQSHLAALSPSLAPWHSHAVHTDRPLQPGHCPELACGASHWENSLLAVRGISTSQLWNSTLPSSRLPVALQARSGACKISARRSQLSQTQLGRTQTPPLSLYCRRLQHPNASPWLLHRPHLWSRAMVTILCQRAPDTLLPFTHKRLRLLIVGAILYSYHFFRTTALKPWGKKWNSSFRAPGKFQVWSFKLKRKFSRQELCQLLWEYKYQSNIFVLFACHLLQQSCGQGDLSPRYSCCICSLNYLFILGGCCQRMLLNAEPRAESILQSDMKLIIWAKKSTSCAIL